MTDPADPAQRARAREPEDLDRLFLERAQAGDVEGVVALYEPDAVFAAPTGELIHGHAALRDFYTTLFADPPSFTGTVNPAVRHGDLALTTTHFPGGATAEIARRQPDGTWLWLADQANVLGQPPPAAMTPAEREDRWTLILRFVVSAAGEAEARAVTGQALARLDRDLPLAAPPAVTQRQQRGTWSVTLSPDLTLLTSIEPDDATNRCRYVSSHFPGGISWTSQPTPASDRWDWSLGTQPQDPAHDAVLMPPALEAVSIYCAAK
jgi:ketosteroid isomerase-like protein